MPFTVEDAEDDDFWGDATIFGCVRPRAHLGEANADGMGGATFFL